MTMHSADTDARDFTDLGVDDDLVARLAADGCDQPFPIQAMTLPDALAGRDICGRAATGAGKTLAFALPLAMRVGRARPNHPRALILVPTRELAAQVRDTLRPLAEARSRRVATVYGGTSIGKDQQRLRRGVDALVATPGRLADLVKRGDCRLDEVSLVVLDEADRMADMGFLPEVKRLLDATASDRQTLLFSATLDGDVDELVRRYQHDPARHEVAVAEEDRGDVRHLFWAAQRHERRGLTRDIVSRVGSAIVFTRTKHGADRLAKQLRTDGIETAAIHGNRSQNQRERALKQFRAGEVTTLVATDIAARGIHIDDVSAVVHYDLPGSDKDYVHRSGRTGRAGATGLVVSLVDEDEQARDWARLQRDLGVPAGVHARDYDVLARTDAPLGEVRALAGAPEQHGHRESRPGQGRSGQGKSQGKGGHGRGGQGGNRRRGGQGGGQRGRSQGSAGGQGRGPGGSRQRRSR